MVKRRGTSANRTKSGKPSAAARRKYGASKSSPNRTGSFPIFDQKSASSAIRLRGKAKSPSAVLKKASRWATAHRNSTIKAMVKRARKK